MAVSWFIFSIALMIITNEVSSSVSAESSNTRRLDFLNSDAIRQRAISHKLQMLVQQRLRLPSIASTNNRKLLWENKMSTVNSKNDDDKNVSMEMPMRSGSDYGIGQYLVAFKAGTPSQKFTLIADTGSDWTWMNCNYGCRGGSSSSRCSSRTSLHRRVFQADESSSFGKIPCSSDMCKFQLANLFSLAFCPSPSRPCRYDYRYSDGSFTKGFFANETVTAGLSNGRKTRVNNVLIGCSESSRGLSFRNQVAADGILGLGYSKSSFAIKASQYFGGRFSYCLADHLSPRNVSNYLSFGTYHNPRSMKYTTLGAISSFYAVNVRGISLGGVMLNIPAEIWDVNRVGGAIIDSGSSLTYLASPAYEPLVAALKVSLVRFQQLNLQIEPLRYCFNATGYDESLDVPRLSFHFNDGARFEPPVKSYVIDAAKGVKCIGLVPKAWPGVSVIGNIMQQNHLWEFDLIRGRLGFTSSSCT